MVEAYLMNTCMKRMAARNLSTVRNEYIHCINTSEQMTNVFYYAMATFVQSKVLYNFIRLDCSNKSRIGYTIYFFSLSY